MTSQNFLVSRSTRSLGSAWGGNSVNCVPYRGAFVSDTEYRYVCYYSADGHLKVTRQRISDGRLHTVSVRSDIRPYDAHQSVGIGIDENRRLHLAFGAHVSALWGTTLTTDQFEDGFLPPRVLFPEATYPMFINDVDGQLFMLYRTGRHFDGELLVSRFDAVSHSWRNDMLPVASGRHAQWTSGPYVNAPTRDNAGVVHLFLVWRQQGEATSEGDVVNIGIDYACSGDGLRSIHTARGARLSKPVTQSNAERVIPVAIGASLINQSSSGVLPGNLPAALTYWDEGDGIPQYQFCWYDGRTWHKRVVSNFTTPFHIRGAGTLPLPHSRPEFVTYESGILVVYRSIERNNNLVCRLLRAPEFSLENSSEQVLVGHDLGHYEPILDKEAWNRDRELVIYVQSCRQRFGSDGLNDEWASKAKLMSWKLRSRRRSSSIRC